MKPFAIVCACSRAAPHSGAACWEAGEACSRMKGLLTVPGHGTGAHPHRRGESKHALVFFWDHIDKWCDLAPNPLESPLIAPFCIQGRRYEGYWYQKQLVWPNSAIARGGSRFPGDGLLTPTPRNQILASLPPVPGNSNLPVSQSILYSFEEETVLNFHILVHHQGKPG